MDVLCITFDNQLDNVEHFMFSDISLALYHYMCKNIVGSEKHVNTLRLMNTVSDNLSSDEMIVNITSGSFGEGLQMIGSDLDIMWVLKLIEVHDSLTSIVFNSKSTYLSMITEHTKPGYVMLRLLRSPTAPVHNSCEQFRGDNYFSSTLFKNNFLNDRRTVVHGPCISDKKGYIDYALCLHSKFWFTYASGWKIT